MHTILKRNRPLVTTVAISVVLVCIIVFGWASTKLISAGAPLPFATIEQVEWPPSGDLYESRQQGMIIVSRVEDINSLGRYIGEESVRQVQTLDFTRYFALAAFQGWKPGTAYTITVNRLRWEGDTVNVYASFLEPKPNEASGATETSPFHLIKVNKGSKWGKDITFNLFSGDTLVASVEHTIP
jgi:hypothetical protein